METIAPIIVALFPVLSLAGGVFVLYSLYKQQKKQNPELTPALFAKQRNVPVLGFAFIGSAVMMAFILYLFVIPSMGA